MVSAREIPPGGEGKIKVSISTKGRSGNLAKTVTVHSNDPETPRLGLQVKGNVELLAGLYPRHVSFGSVTQGKKVSRQVKLAGKLAPTLELTKLESDRPKQLRAKLIRVDGRPAIEVTLDSRGHDGHFRGTVTITTNVERPKQLTLGVWANVVGDLVPNRRFVLFSPFDPNGTAPSAELRLSSTSGRRFRVRGIADPSGAVTGKAVRKGKDWELLLTLTKAPPAGSGKLKIRTDRRDQREIEIRYSVRSAPVGRQATRVWHRLKKGALLERAKLKPTAVKRPPTK